MTKLTPWSEVEARYFTPEEIARSEDWARRTSRYMNMLKLKPKKERRPIRFTGPLDLPSIAVARYYVQLKDIAETTELVNQCIQTLWRRHEEIMELKKENEELKEGRRLTIDKADKSGT